MNPELPKGTKDIPPEAKRMRDKIVQHLVAVFERYGFVPLETPTFERMEVLASKFAGGEEILKEIFTFEDQGKRKLGLRYDHTVPLARYIALNPTLKMPFKRYAIGRVYRDGPIKRGRLREFYQCDVDIVGTKSMLADATCLMIAHDCFEALQLPVVLKINNRKLMNGLMKDAGIALAYCERAILAIDKLDKLGFDAVAAELTAQGISSSSIKRLFEQFSATSLDTLSLQDPEGIEGKKELAEVFSYLGAVGVSAVFSPSLARGLAYYTGTVFEGYLTKELTSVAVCGGGRYDKMIGKLMGATQDIPAVGISFGLEVLAEVLQPSEESSVLVYLVPVGDTVLHALSLAAALRKEGIATDLDYYGRGISKNLAYANSQKIPYALIIGEEELANNSYQLKDMLSGQQQQLSFEACKEFLVKQMQARSNRIKNKI
ncbi:MAG: histidine--tRNA ligase [Candidatus Woesearchaeota archaeon]